jgi:hypothetical protein
MRTMKRTSGILTSIAAGCLLAAAPVAAAPINIAGSTYDTVNFADTLVSSQALGGSFVVSAGAGSLADAVTGWDVTQWAFCNCTSAFVELGFTDNVVTNGAGADLTLFEIGTPDNFGISLTVGGVTQTIASVATGFSAGGYNINVATVDLSLFGLTPGATVSSIVVNMGFPYAGTSNSPTLGAVVALHDSSAPVPEPTLLALLGAGLAGGALRVRRLRS